MLDYCRFRDINDLFASGQPHKARRLLMEMQSRYIALRDEISMLRLRVQTAEDALYLSRNLYQEDGLYWLKGGQERQGPFCPSCYSSENALIRLDKFKRELICPYCHESYQIKANPPENTPLIHAKILRFAR